MKGAKFYVVHQNSQPFVSHACWSYCKIKLQVTDNIWGEVVVCDHSAGGRLINCILPSFHFEQAGILQCLRLTELHWAQVLLSALWWRHWLFSSSLLTCHAMWWTGREFWCSSVRRCEAVRQVTRMLSLAGESAILFYKCTGTVYYSVECMLISVASASSRVNCNESDSCD